MGYKNLTTATCPPLIQNESSLPLSKMNVALGYFPVCWRTELADGVGGDEGTGSLIQGERLLFDGFRVGENTFWTRSFYLE